MKITKQQINQWVAEAIQMVPQPMLRKMRHLVFEVDDRPTRAQLRDCQLRRGYALFGLYQGSGQISRKALSSTPDKISVFRKAIMEQYQRPSKVKQQVFKTVWHEIAHHFGADEAGAEKAELQMFEKYGQLQLAQGTHKRQVRKKMTVKKGRRGYKRKTKITFRVSRG